MLMIQVSNLTYYPIKACRGFDVTESEVERMGLVDDRRMMVVTPEGQFLTQREHPRLALVTPALKHDLLQLSAPNFDSIHLNLQKSGTPWKVGIWRSKSVDAIDQGDEAADWFSDWLGTSVRLVHIAEGFKRRLNPDYRVNADDHTAFADGYPILLISEGSLLDLNSRLDSPVPMNRFRPNLVVRGCEPFAEDTWNRIRIGDVEMAVVKPCPRCVVTTIDKETLAQNKEPLKTLSTFRKQVGAEQGAALSLSKGRSVGGVMFGQNVIPLNEGRLEVGMKVEFISS